MELTKQVQNRSLYQLIYTKQGEIKVTYYSHCNIFNHLEKKIYLGLYIITANTKASIVKR